MDDTVVSLIKKEIKRRRWSCCWKRDILYPNRSKSKTLVGCGGCERRRMGRSRRKYKQSRTKVRVGLPKKNPRLFKPTFSVPPKLLKTLDEEPQWDDQGSVNHNYHSFGVLSDPNAIESSPVDVTIDSGSDLEEDGILFCSF